MNSRKELRFGIVGAGYIAGVHSAALRTASGTYPDTPFRVALKAVADADSQRAAQLQRAWEWERTESDWRTVTRAPDIDVVNVCVPNVLHSEVAIDALAHGKHVICEKPLAHDVPSARAMADAALEAPTLTQVCFVYRLWPAIAWARRLLDDGVVGQIQYFRGWMLQDYAARSDLDLGWRADRPQSGAGAVGDLGSHIFDVARHLCGEIAELCASTHRFVERAGHIDDAVSALVRFESGAAGVLEASWAMRGHKCDLGFDLVGSEGAIRFSWERSNELEVLRGDAATEGTNGFERVLIGGGQPDVERFVAVPGQGLGYRDAFTISLGRFLQALDAGATSVAPTFAEGLRVAELIDASLRSSEEGGWKRIEDPASTLA